MTLQGLSILHRQCNTAAYESNNDAHHMAKWGSSLAKDCVMMENVPHMVYCFVTAYNAAHHLAKSCSS